MSNTRKFRIIIADDDENIDFTNAIKNACPAAELWWVKFLSDESDARPKPLSDEENKLWEGADKTKKSEMWNAKTLFNSDVLILDMHMPCATKWHKRGIPAQFGGACFINTQHSNLACQAVFISTALDDDTAVFVDHLTTEPELRPPVMKFSKIIKSDENKIIDIVKTLSEAYTNGFVDLTDLGAIEFAAVHSYPVLIIGESGTGKENIARSIHHRWSIERAREEGKSPGDFGFYPQNCAGLSVNFARDELFGHVKNAFSDASDHKLGICLLAAGLKSFSAGNATNNLEQHFAAELVRQNQALFDSRKDLHIKLKIKKPLGTLFLDEFGDLPQDVQSLLLRYLQTKEVSPLGYSGVISGAFVRVIAATSDPGVAEMVGEKLFSRKRIKNEGNIQALREDLIFRIKNQVIRVTPVNDKNVREVLLKIIDAKKGHEWEDAAINYVVDRVKEINDEIQTAIKEGKQPVYAFGHRRELSNLVTMAERYLDTAKQRGIRGIGNKVNEDIISKIWKPSMVDVLGITHNVLDRAAFRDIQTNEEKHGSKTLKLFSNFDTPYDIEKLERVIAEIDSTNGKCIKNNPDTIIEGHGVPFLRPILAVFWNKYSNQKAKFNAIFGFENEGRKKVSLKSYLQQKSKKYPEIFPPIGGKKIYGMTELREDILQIGEKIRINTPL